MLFRQMKILSFLSCFILLNHFSFSQKGISGTIKDKTTQLAIPFASIGILGTNIGTLSDEKGNFELPGQHFSDTDTLRISSIGYSNFSAPVSEIKKNNKLFYLTPMVYNLTEIKVKPKNPAHKILGTANYSKDVCTAFIGQNNNCKGEQAAIKAISKDSVTVYFESFNFYIIKNEYPDSLKFRIMFYEVNAKGFPGETFLKKPIIFKTNTKQGEVHIDLKNYEISTAGDFFISLECLEEKLEPTKFCFAGTIRVPSFFKTSTFGKWGKVKGGGGDFNVRVGYEL